MDLGLTKGAPSTKDAQKSLEWGKCHARARVFVSLKWALGDSQAALKILKYIWCKFENKFKKT